MDTNTYKENNAVFDTAVDFLEYWSSEAGLDGFELGKAFEYNETQHTDTDGYITETVLFNHKASGRTIGIEVDKNTVTSVWVSENGTWIDDGTDAADICRDPKGWFEKTLLPNNHLVAVSADMVDRINKAISGGSEDDDEG